MKMTNFLWVVLWVRGVSKTHNILIKFGKTQQSYFVQLHHFLVRVRSHREVVFLYPQKLTGNKKTTLTSSFFIKQRVDGQRQIQ